MSIPEHLKDVALIVPDKRIVGFCRQKGVESICFYDDVRHSNSIRAGNDIFINTRGTYWANYILSPWNAKSLAETIFLRILHEIGHVVNNHPGDVGIINARLILNRKPDYWENAFLGHEGEAWDYAFKFKQDSKNEYNEYVEILKSWVNTHIFVNRDWDEKYTDQFFKVFQFGIEEQNERFPVPQWVRDRFAYLKIC
ncbi:hypothetical protein [Paenibacillus odorifer]|uniref:hypothetical protein n=1 Tax=Paenibacillus odorifer TaxID=189426 RepID=UPI00096D9A01|nr:hypothetical protein [Paenibacillus odorifer]OME41447.1 hypothetical protein BSK58_15055 [Paenibacillus odorifer]